MECGVKENYSTLHTPNSTRSVGAVVSQALGDLDDAAGAQTVCAQSDELLSIFNAGDTAGSLDLHMRGNVLCKQVPAQTVAIELEPFDSRMSLTMRTV